jgi:outer membrane protein
MKKYTLKLFVLSLLIGSVSQGIQAQKVLSLDECIRLSLTNNLQVKNNEIDVQTVLSKINETKSSFLPSIDLTGQYQYYISMPKMLVPASFFDSTAPAGTYAELSLGSEQTTSAGLQVSQLLYNQKVFIGLKAAKTAKNMTELQLGKTKEDLKYNVSAVYYNLQVIQSNLQVLQKNMQSLQQIINASKSLNENGILSKTNYKRLEINLENLKNEQLNLQLTNEKAHNLLKFLLGLPLTDDVTVEQYDDARMISTDNMVSGNFEDRMDVKLVKEQVQLAELDKQAAVAEYYPSLAGVYNYGVTGYNNKVAPFQTINDRWMKSSYVALQLNIPIFSGFSRMQKVKQKDNDLRKAKNSYELLRQSAERDLTDAKNNVLSASNTFENARRNLQLAQEVLQSSTTEYQNGLISLSDVLQIQNELTQARNTYSTALINMKLADIEWRKSVGK